MKSIDIIYSTHGESKNYQMVVDDNVSIFQAVKEFTQLSGISIDDIEDANLTDANNAEDDLQIYRFINEVNMITSHSTTKSQALAEVLHSTFKLLTTEQKKEFWKLAPVAGANQNFQCINQQAH